MRDASLSGRADLLSSYSSLLAKHLSNTAHTGRIVFRSANLSKQLARIFLTMMSTRPTVSS
jgi:hypothetical protein